MLQKTFRMAPRRPQYGVLLAEKAKEKGDLENGGDDKFKDILSISTRRSNSMRSDMSKLPTCTTSGSVTWQRP